MTKILRIGTRGSKLALIQTGMVVAALRQHYPDLAIDVIEIKTSGDWKPSDGETRLAEAEGGKGLFAREIEQALLAGGIDCGVHSMKDMASFLPGGLALDHMLPREDARDAFLGNGHKCLADLPQGAVVGTSSLRRQAFVLAKRPDLKVVPLRGNVPTRIEKLRSGQVDATILAYAGLKRLGLESEADCVIEPEDMLPAAGQGAVGIETRTGDDETRTLFDALHCRSTGLCVTAERAALQVLDGSCRTPIGAYAVLDGAIMRLAAVVASPDGKQFFHEAVAGGVDTTAQAAALGQRAGAALKERAPPDLLA